MPIRSSRLNRHAAVPLPSFAASHVDAPSLRLRRISREDALEQVDLATLALAYLAGEPVFIGRGDAWRWERDGIPGWLVPQLADLGFLP